MGWNLTNIQLPVATNVRTRKRQQAVVAEPGMIPFLEAGIITAAEHNNPEWMALLASDVCGTDTSPRVSPSGCLPRLSMPGARRESRHTPGMGLPGQLLPSSPMGFRVLRE